MAITLGTRLGPYEISSAIGVGGMGEVYKAQDTRLNRTVTIKVLPANLGEKPGLRERYEWGGAYEFRTSQCTRRR